MIWSTTSSLASLQQPTTKNTDVRALPINNYTKRNKTVCHKNLTNSRRTNCNTATRNKAIANRSPSSSHNNSPSGRICTCTECPLCQINPHSCTQNATEAVASLQPLPAHPHGSLVKIVHWCYLPVCSTAIDCALVFANRRHVSVTQR